MPALLAAGGALEGVFGDVEGLLSALSFAGAEGVFGDDVAPDWLGASLVSLDAFAGADFSCWVEVLDLAAGSFESDEVFGAGFFSWADFDRLSGSFVSDSAFEGDLWSASPLGLVAVGCSFDSF